MEKKTSGKKSKLLKTIERIFSLYIIRSITFDVLAIIFGVFFIVKPYSGIRTCEIIFGIFLLLSGAVSVFDYSTKKVVNIFNFNMFYGVLSLLFGLLILVNPLALANIITLVFGLWITLSGVVKLNYAINLKKMKEESWSVVLGIGLLTSIVGLLLIFNPFIELYITQVLGIFVIFYAVLDFTNNILFKKRSKQIIEIFK